VNQHLIYRGVIYHIEEPIFTNSSRISYRKIKGEGLAHLRLNRASTNKFEVFYGAFPIPGVDDVILPAIVEIDSIRENDFPEEEYEYVAIGEWFVRMPFVVAAVGMHSDLAGNNEWAKNIVKFDRQFCDQFEHGEFILEVMNFMGVEFSRTITKEQDYLYKISAAYGDSLFEAGVEGILYPSVQTGGKSINIAVRGDVVDHCLDINLCGIVKGAKISSNIFYGWHLQCPRINGQEIKWEIPPSNGQIWQADLRIFRSYMNENGGKFINPLGETIVV
jgi:hypothetical protein